jgi:lipopolysaccharide transport system permease protein
MITQIKTAVQSRDLLFSWVGRTIRGRYQQSALGWLWAIIQPAATVAIFTIIFTRIVRVDTGNIPYVIFSYVALVPWTLLSASLADMTNSLVGNMSLVTKIYFPREVLPVSAMLARLMDFGVAASLIILLMIFFQVPVYPFGWLFLPVILVIQLALIIGIGLAAAAANVFYRDVQSLLVLVVQLWFYASPIIYPVTMVPQQYQAIYFINPMAGILESYRAVLLYQALPGFYLLQAGLISFLILFAGYWFFKRVEFLFADVV